VKAEKEATLKAAKEATENKRQMTTDFIFPYGNFDQQYRDTFVGIRPVS
jgi:hypothetical protein